MNPVSENPFLGLPKNVENLSAGAICSNHVIGISLYVTVSASTNINDETRNTMRSSGGNNTIVNSPTTNVASGGNQKGRSAPVYDTDMTNTLMGRQYA